MRTVSQHCVSRFQAHTNRRAASNHVIIRGKKTRIAYRTGDMQVRVESQMRKCACCGVRTDEMVLDVCEECAKLTPVQWYLMANDAPDDGRDSCLLAVL